MTETLSEKKRSHVKEKMSNYNTQLQKNLALKKRVELVESTSSKLAVQLVSQKKATKCNHEHLMDLAKTISTADSHVKATTTNRLKQIADQIKRLQQEATHILESAKRDKMLHQAACNIVKKPGQMYYLYEKDLDDKGEFTQAYFSIMSPEDWGKRMPHRYLGGYRLGYDMQFTEEKDIGKDQDTWDIIHNIYEKVTDVQQFAMEDGKVSVALDAFNVGDFSMAITDKMWLEIDEKNAKNENAKNDQKNMKILCSDEIELKTMFRILTISIRKVQLVPIPRYHYKLHNMLKI